MLIFRFPHFSSPEINYQFKYCLTSSEECVALSSCRYEESVLKREVEGIENDQVRNHFDWIFFSSGYSSEKILAFLSELIALFLTKKFNSPFLHGDRDFAGPGKNSPLPRKTRPLPSQSRDSIR